MAFCGFPVKTGDIYITHVHRHRHTHTHTHAHTDRYADADTYTYSLSLFPPLSYVVFLFFSLCIEKKKPKSLTPVSLQKLPDCPPHAL